MAISRPCLKDPRHHFPLPPHLCHRVQQSKKLWQTLSATSHK
jgi:hypothetical protein